MLEVDAKTFNPEILYVFANQSTIAQKCQLHEHDFIELSIMLSGESEYTINGQIKTIKAPAVLVFNPHTWHQEEQLEKTQSLQLHIGIRHLFLTGIMHDHFPFSESQINLGSQTEEFMLLCQRIIDEQQKQALGFETLIKAYISQLLIMLIRSAPLNAEDLAALSTIPTVQAKENLVAQVIYYLQAHHQEEITLETLAEHFYVNPTYLSRVFKTATQQTPINYLIQLRLNRAKKLLESSDISVKDAAQSVGYQDAYHFSKLFKKYFGQAPSTFSN